MAVMPVFSRALCCAAALLTTTARGEQGPLLLLLEDGSGALSPTALRASVAAELGRQVLPPDDRRAIDVVGWVLVLVDAERTAHVLYEERGSEGDSLSRAVRLPAKAEDSLTLLTLLASDLVRRAASGRLQLSEPSERAEVAQTRADPEPWVWAAEAGVGGGYLLTGVFRNLEYVTLQVAVRRGWSRRNTGLEGQYAFSSPLLTGTSIRLVPEHSFTVTGHAQWYWGRFGLEVGVGLGALYGPVTGLAPLVRLVPAVAFRTQTVDVVFQPELRWVTSNWVQVGVSLRMRWWIL
jgi:hypothetical protein